MSEGVASSGPATEPSRTIASVLVPLLLGLLSIAGFWFGTQSGSVTGEALLFGGIGLVVFAGALFVFRLPMRDPRDYYGGLALFGLALFMLWASSDLPGMRGFAFGPGTAPRIFAGVLAGLSLLVMVLGMFSEGPGLERYDISAPVLLIVGVCIGTFGQSVELKIVAAVCGVAGVLLAIIALLRGRGQAMRGPLFITLGTLVFAMTIRQLGMVLASWLSIVTVAAGSNEVRWIETVIWAAVLTGFCVLVFPIALNLPLQLWPSPNLSFSTILNFR